MSESDNGYYGNTPIMTFKKLVHSVPTTKKEALRLALVLAITAPTEDDAHDVLEMAVHLCDSLTDCEVKEVKLEASRIVEERGDLRWRGEA